jgi:hypothetical protein
MHVLQRAVLTALVVTTLAAGAAAQTSTVTQGDIQRLQDNIFQATTDVTQLRSRDGSRADRLQSELDDLREEVIYLKVKLRKERSLSRTEYADVRDRIEDLRTRAREDRFASTAPPVTTAPSTTTGTTTGSRATTSTGTTRGGTATASSSAQGTAARTMEVPAGTEIDVRLTNNLNSGTAQVEDRFEGTTLVDLNIEGRTVIPAGSVVRGVVTAVEPATRTNRTARLTVSFDQVTVNGRAYPMRGTVTQAIEGEGIRGEVGRVGTGAGVGAIIGGILGGFKGALAGILIGAGGTIAATEGREVELAQGSVLRVRIDSPLQIQTTR